MPWSTIATITNSIGGYRYYVSVYDNGESIFSMFLGYNNKI